MTRNFEKPRYRILQAKNSIEEKDIHTVNLSTQLEYDYKKTGEIVLKAYRAVRQVQVTVRRIR